MGGAWPQGAWDSPWAPEVPRVAVPQVGAVDCDREKIELKMMLQAATTMLRTQWSLLASRTCSCLMRDGCRIVCPSCSMTTAMFDMLEEAAKLSQREEFYVHGQVTPEMAEHVVDGAGELLRRLDGDDG